MTDQAEEEVCKNYMENGKKSFWETLTYTDVGNRENAVFFLPMLFSNWNGSFSGAKVTLREAESLFQGLKWGEKALMSCKGDDTGIRNCLRRQAFREDVRDVLVQVTTAKRLLEPRGFSERIKYLSCLARKQFRARKNTGRKRESHLF